MTMRQKIISAGAVAGAIAAIGAVFIAAGQEAANAVVWIDDAEEVHENDPVQDERLDELETKALKAQTERELLKELDIQTRLDYAKDFQEKAQQRAAERRAFERLQREETPPQ